MSSFLQTLKKSVKNKGGRVAFPESTDLRILQAMNQLLAEKAVGEIYVFSARAEILDLAKKHKLEAILKEEKRLCCVGEDLKISAMDMLIHLKEQMQQKPVSDQALSEFLENPLYQAGFLLSQGRVHCVLAGAVTESSQVIRAAVRSVGKAEGVGNISGAFILERKDEILLFADAAVTIEPSLEELVDIAFASKETWEALPLLAERDVRIAFLSFSTKGSAKHRSCTKMAEAADLVKKRDAKVLVDGELQFDAAFDAEVGKRKAPGSSVAGQANIFIFPDLNAANIAYKIAQRLGSFSAYGPLLQGLKKPYSDLSRGASVHDIVVCTYINLLRGTQEL